MFNKQAALEAIGTIVELRNGVKKARKIAQGKLTSFRTIYGEFTGETLNSFQFADSNLNSSFVLSQAKKLLSRKVTGEVPELLSDFYPTCKPVHGGRGLIYIGDQITSKIDFQIHSATVQILKSSDDSLDLFEGEDVVPVEEFIDKTSVKYNDDKVDEVVDYLSEHGASENQDDSEFCPLQLATGVLVEVEHADDFDVAKEIAKDHLAEDPEYYSKYFFPEEAEERIEDITEGEEPDFEEIKSSGYKNPTDWTEDQIRRQVEYYKNMDSAVFNWGNKWNLNIKRFVYPWCIRWVVDNSRIDDKVLDDFEKELGDKYYLFTNEMEVPGLNVITLGTYDDDLRVYLRLRDFYKDDKDTIFQWRETGLGVKDLNSFTIFDMFDGTYSVGKGEKIIKRGFSSIDEAEQFINKNYVFDDSDFEEEEIDSSRKSIKQSVDYSVYGKYVQQVVDKLKTLGWLDNYKYNKGDRAKTDGNWKGLYNPNTWESVDPKGNDFWKWDDDSGSSAPAHLRKYHSGNILRIVNKPDYDINKTLFENQRMV